MVWERVQSIAADAGVELEGSDLEYNLLTGSVSVRDLSARSLAAPDSTPFLTADQLELNLSVRDLMSAAIRVEDGRLVDPHLVVVLPAEGGSNLPASSSEPGTNGSTAGPSVVVERFSAEGGSFLLDDRGRQLSVELPLWSLLIRSGAAGDTDLQFSTERSGTVRFQDRETNIASLGVDGSWGDQGLTVSELKMEAPGLGVSTRGSGSFGSEQEWSIAVDADAARLAEFFRVEQDVAGAVTLTLEGSGPADEPQLHVTISSPSFEYNSLRDMAVEIDALWPLGGDTVQLEGADLRSDFGEIDASGRLALVEPATSSIDAQIRGLRLSRLTREFGTPVDVAGAASGQAQLSWRGQTVESARNTLAGSASLRFTPTLSAPRENILPVGGSLRLDAEGGVTQLAIRSLAALGSEWNGQVRLGRSETLSGNVSSEVADLGSALEQWQRFRGAEAEEPLEAGGSVAVDVSLGGTLHSPRSAIEAQANDLSWGDIDGAVLEARADFAGDELAIERFAIDWAGQSAETDGRVWLRSSGGELALNFNAVNVDVASILSATKSEPSMTGTVNVSGTVTGQADDPNAVFEISGNELAVSAQQLGTLEARVELAAGVLRVPTFRLDQQPSAGNGGTLSGSGEYRLEDGRYSLEATGRGFAIDQPVSEGGNTIRGVLSLDVAGDGSVDDPGLKGTLNLADASYGSQELGDISAEVSVEDGRAQINGRAPLFGAVLIAEADTSAPYDVFANLAVDDADISNWALSDPSGNPVTGSVSAELEARGPLEDWQLMSVNVALRDTAVEARTAQGETVSVKTLDDVIARYAGGELAIESGRIGLGQSTIALSGSLPVEGPATGSELQLTGELSLDELAAFVPLETPVEAAGTLKFQAAVGGSLQEPEPRIDAEISDAAIGHELLRSPVTELNGAVRFENEALELTRLSATWAGAKLAATGAVPVALLADGAELATAEPFELSWSLDGLMLDELAELPRATGARVSMEGQIKGTQPELSALTGSVEFNELTLNHESTVITQQKPARLRLADGVVRVESFALDGPNFQSSLAGTLSLEPELSLNLELLTDADASVLAQFLEDVSARGPLHLRVTGTGDLFDPRLRGEFTWKSGEVALSSVGLAAENLDVQVELSPEVIEVRQFTGSLNGGRLDASGSVGYSGGAIGPVDLSIDADGVFLQAPEGLRTISNAQLTVRDRGENIVIGGNVQVEEGVYRDSVTLDQLLFDAFGSGGPTSFVSEPDPLLARLRFDIAIESADPIVVDNNLAELGATVDTRLTGSYYQPGVVGRLELEEGGQLYVAENRYFIDRGVIDFLNENSIEPTLNIVARTQVRNKYDIELTITGGGNEKVETLLASSSHPELGEPDLISLLLTGRLREDLRGEEITAASEQSLSYLTGRIGGRLAQIAESSLGLTEVRIEPNLIAAESDPGARLTIGRNLNSAISLVTSMNLTDSSDQIWTVRYDLSRRFLARGVRQPNDTYRGDFQHDLRFGGGKDSGRARRKKESRTVGEVAVGGEHPLDEAEVRRKLGAKPGKPYDFFALSRGSEKIEKILRKQGFLEARVSVDRSIEAATVDLNITVEAGPRTNIIFEGWTPSDKLRREVRNKWSEGVFDAQRVDDVRKAVLIDLTSRGYLSAAMQPEVTEIGTGEKRVLLDVAPGTHYADVSLTFGETTEFSDKAIRKRLEAEELLAGLHVEPGRSARFLKEWFRSEGFLDVEVERPNYELNAQNRTAKVIIPVVEGPRYHVGELTINGAEALSEERLRQAANLPDDAVHRAALVQDLFLRMEEAYWHAGYRDVVLNFDLTKDDEKHQVRIDANIVENRQSVVKRVDVEGTRVTSEKLARSQLGIKPGDALDFEAAGKGRKRLYETGAYTLADLRYEPAEPTAGQTVPPGVKPLVAKLNVREVKPFDVRYGGFFDTDRGPGAIVDFRNRNTLGSARLMGVRLRADNEFKEARVFLSQPLLQRFPLATNLVGFTSRETRLGFITDRTGASVSQETRWSNDRYILNYGYRFERALSKLVEPDPFFPDPIPLNVAPLTVAFTRETRNDVLDPSRGALVSNSFEWAPAKLGSDLRFVRYFGQLFKYFPLATPTELPYQRGIRRSRWVYATGFRIGLASGLGGQVLPPSERFFAGGGTSLRGFQDDTLGPQDFFGDPTGGNAMILLNNELRFPVRGIVDGVAFVDVGNVYETVDQFQFSDLRKSAGLGVRVRTPFFMLRADYGLKLDRRTGESAGQIFFSIGQAF